MTQEEESRDILEEIRAGMAAVTAQQLLEAPPFAQMREPGEPPLGEADEYLKRLFWYIVAEGKKLEPLVEEAQRLASELKGESIHLPDGSILVSPTPEHFATAVRIKELHEALEIPIQLNNGLWLIFYAEARRRNPLLRQCTRPIICVDWTFSDADYEGAEQGGIGPANDQESFPGTFLHLAESDTPQ
ncbi:MAG: hypothetical protein Q7S95_02165 [bacterium]|nr:hypothetical protein [bacterium]